MSDTYEINSRNCPKCGKFPFVPGTKTVNGNYHASNFCQCNKTAKVVIDSNPDWWSVRNGLRIEIVDNGKLKCPFTQQSCILNDTAAYSSCPFCSNYNPGAIGLAIPCKDEDVTWDEVIAEAKNHAADGCNLTDAEFYNHVFNYLRNNYQLKKKEK